MSRASTENLEHDALLEYSSRFIHYYRNNKGVVWGTGIGVVLAIGLIIGWFVMSHRSESRAEILLGMAEEHYRSGELERALYGDDRELTPGFIQISENFSRTRAGNLASYYAAVISLDLGQPDEALRFIERFRVPSGILGVGPLSLHGVILAELGEYEAAAAKFEEAAGWNENHRTTPYNLLQAAMAFEEAGLSDRALQQLDRILEEYPDSPQFPDAQRMKGRLSVRT